MPPICRRAAADRGTFSHRRLTEHDPVLPSWPRSQTEGPALQSTMMRHPLVLPRALARAETLYAGRQIVSRYADRSLHR